MDNFILNREQYFNVLDQIVKEETEYLKEDNPNLISLCFHISKNIDNALKYLKIPSVIVNTKKLYDMYEHQFVLSSYEDSTILIDPSFRQFLHKDNDYEIKYPIDILVESKEGIRIAKELLNKGYIEITNEDLKRFIASLMLETDISKVDININDLMKGDINEKSIKWNN